MMDKMGTIPAKTFYERCECSMYTNRFRKLTAAILCLLLAALLPAVALCDVLSCFPAQFKLYETCPPAAAAFPSPSYTYNTDDAATTQVTITLPEELELDETSYGVYRLSEGDTGSIIPRVEDGEKGTVQVFFPAATTQTFLTPAVTCTNPDVDLLMGLFPETQEVILQLTRKDDGSSISLDCNGNVVLMWSENGFPQSATYDADGVLAEYMSIYADEKCYRIIGYYPMGQTGTEGEPYLTCVLNVSETGETLIYRSTTGWASEKDPEATDVQPPEWFDAAWLEAPQTYPN